MLCENCKNNEAVFYYHENVNGEEKSYKLCRECLDKLKSDGKIKLSDTSVPEISFNSFFDDGIFGEAFKSVDSLFSNFFKAGGTSLGSGASLKKCPSCGSTLGDISKSGRVGCTDCYSAFRRELEGAIERIHGHASHSGRSPRKIGIESEIKKRITALESEQKEAVRTENYERAALIRDELKKLRSGL